MVELEPPGLDLRDVEDVVEDHEQRFGRLVGGTDVLALLRRRAGSGGRGSVIPITAFIGRADLVAHVGQELALGRRRRLRLPALLLQLGDELFQVFRRILQRFARLLAFGDVTGHRVDDAPIEEGAETHSSQRYEPSRVR